MLSVLSYRLHPVLPRKVRVIWLHFLSVWVNWGWHHVLRLSLTHKVNRWHKEIIVWPCKLLLQNKVLWDLLFMRHLSLLERILIILFSIDQLLEVWTTLGISIADFRSAYSFKSLRLVILKNRRTRSHLWSSLVILLINSWLDLFKNISSVHFGNSLLIVSSSITFAFKNLSGIFVVSSLTERTQKSSHLMTWLLILEFSGEHILFDWFRTGIVWCSIDLSWSCQQVIVILCTSADRLTSFWNFKIIHYFNVWYIWRLWWTEVHAFLS